MTRLSVVIPVKDDAVLLERCLEALHRQTRRPDQIVVVDNDSRDLTADVARWWGVRYVFEPERGIPAASATGYDAADGDLIARLDADSLPSGDWAERVVASFDHDADLEALTGPGEFAELPRPLRTIADHAYMRSYFGLLRPLIGHAPLFGSNFAMRRSTWEAVRDSAHRHDPELHDDLDLSFRFGAGRRIAFDPDLQVQVSARPFRDPIAFLRRIWRALRTIAANRDAIAVRARDQRARLIEAVGHR